MRNMRNVFIWIMIGQQMGDFVLPNLAYNVIAHV